MKTVILYFGFLGTIFFMSACKTDDDQKEWNYCDGCPNSIWDGEYEGTGNYYSMNNPEVTEEVTVIVTVTELQDNRIKFLVKSPDKFYKSFTGKKENTDYYFDLSATDRSIHVSLFQKTPQYKLTGTAKSYVYKGDSVILEKSVSFEAFKEQLLK